MERFLSPLAKGISPYIPGEQPKNLGELVKLNTNENPYPPAPAVLRAIEEAANADLRLYPEPTSLPMRKAIAEAEGKGFTIDNVFVGNGSDEVLAFSFPAFFVGKAPIRFADITYSFYKVYASLFAAQTDVIPLREDFTLDLDAFCAPGSGGVLIPNPNAPTGIALGLGDIERVLRANRDVVVLIDEAYIDFGGESASVLIAEYDNLLVVRTLSKSHALAGMRLGYALGQPHLIDGLTRIKDSFNSYPVDRVAQAAGSAAIRAKEYYAACNQKIMHVRDVFAAGLNNLGYRVLPSLANFVFVSPPDGEAKAVQALLRENNILVRYFGSPRIEEWLRISIGTAADMDKVLQVLKGKA